MVVLSSVAGGTGAGIALDVVDLLRATDVQGAFPAMVLFTSDIFDLPASSAAMSANSLGLVSETLAGYWSDADGGNDLLPRTRQSPGVGPHSVFMIGRYGITGADLGDTASVYRAAGEALSKWVTSEDVQSKVHNFIAVNWTNNSKSNYGGFPFGERHQRGVVSSFGAAVLGLGRDRFETWARDLVTFETLQALMSGHLSADSQAEEEDSQRPDSPEFGNEEEELGLDDAAVRAAAEATAGIITGEDRSESQGRPLFDLHELLDHGHTSVRSGISRHLSAALPASQSGTGRQWVHWISQQSERALAEAPGFDSAAWGTEALADACANVSRVLVETSMPAAIAALDLARKSLRERAEDYLMEVPQHMASIDAGRSSARAALSKVSSSLKSDDSKVQEYVRAEVSACTKQWRAARLEKAAECLRAVCSQVLLPAQDALKAAARATASVMRSDEARMLPKHDRGVPDRYRPTAVEFVMEGPDKWPSMLDSMCEEAPSSPYAGVRSVDRMRAVVVQGTPEDPDEDPARGQGITLPLLYASPLRWAPGRAAEIVCDMSAGPVAAVSARAQGWMRRPGSATDRHLSEGLASWLSSKSSVTGRPVPDVHERLARYRRCLSDALACAQPLVRVDSSLYGQTHPSPEPEVQVVCEPFPFGPGHPAAAPTMDSVGPDTFSTTPVDSSSILISTYIPFPMHPIAVRSFTRPVADAVQFCGTSSDRLQSSWWMWRRARTLGEFVPMPPRVMQSMIRGFAIGRILGCVSTVSDESAAQIAAVDGSVYEFPFPLLTRAEPDDTLAALLEGFALTFAHAVSHGLSAFDAYRELYLLGDDAHVLHPELVDWVVTGNLARALSGTAPVSPSEDTMEGRRQAALRYMDRNIAHLRGLVPPVRTYTGREYRSDDGRADPGIPSMELAAKVIPCYESLRTDVETYAEVSKVV